MQRRVRVLALALLCAGCGSGSGGVDPEGATPMATPTELVAIDAFLSNLLVDDSALYFQALSGIRTQPLGGGDHVELATTTGEAMAQDESALWITRGNTGAGQVIRIAKSDGSYETVVAGQLYPTSIAVDETRVYWTNESTYQADPADGSVMMARKDGTEVTELAGQLENPRNVAIDADHVYFTTRIEGGTISRVAKEGSELESLVTAQDWPKSLIVAPGVLYWFNDAAGSTVHAETSPILQYDLTTGETVVLYEDDVRPHDLAFDGEALFWSSQNFGDCTANPDYFDGVVRSLPASGGTVRTLASKLMTANELAIQGEALYFARSLSGCSAIFSLPKR